MFSCSSIEMLTFVRNIFINISRIHMFTNIFGRLHSHTRTYIHIPYMTNNFQLLSLFNNQYSLDKHHHLGLFIHQNPQVDNLQKNYPILTMKMTYFSLQTPNPHFSYIIYKMLLTMLGYISVNLKLNL